MSTNHYGCLGELIFLASLLVFNRYKKTATLVFGDQSGWYFYRQRNEIFCATYCFLKNKTKNSDRLQLGRIREIKRFASGGQFWSVGAAVSAAQALRSASCW